MADASLAITTEYVRNFLALMGKDVIWPDVVRQQVANEGLDALDVTHVLTHGDVIEAEKETADGTAMAIVGLTCDDVRICVRFWTDHDRLTIRLEGVTRT